MRAYRFYGHGRRHWTMAILLLLLSVTDAIQAQVNYWVAPSASGSGSGSDSLDPASYLNNSFWSTVYSQLQNNAVNVNFLSGAYNGGTLGFTNMGSPLHQLVLSSSTPHGAVFAPNANPVIQFLGSQNIELNGMVITGPTMYWGVYCLQSSSGTVPTRNIVINNCWFLNLTNAYYAAIGLLNGVRSIQVLNCNFTNITDVAAGGHQHVIYAPHNNEDVIVSNCIVQDCLADYMRFRDDSEYVVVEDSKFISTMSATAFPFVSAEQYNETNSDAAGDEFFGTYFQVSSNIFNYEATGGTGPDSSLHFSDYGWSPQSYYCDLTSSQATALANGSQSYQQSFLATNMGIIGSDIKMFGNTYLGASTYLMDYGYTWDNESPYNNWAGTVNLYHTPDTSGATMAPVPVLRNGNFDRQGLEETLHTNVSEDYQCLFRNWFATPEHTALFWTPGLDGSSNALRFDATKSQSVYQWITPPGPNWTMDCLFAIGSAYTGTGTKFKVDLFHNDIAGSKVSVGVNNSGQFGIYNGSTFVTLPELGTVAFSVDNNGNGNYTDPGDTLNVYHLRIVGNYTASTPYVDIYTSDANNTFLDHRSPGHSFWVSGAPASGQSSPETIAFYNYTAPVMVDQVSIDEGIPPAIARVYVNQFNGLDFSITNGSPNVTFYLLSSTNITLPLSSWTRLSTNTFNGTAMHIISNVPSNAPQTYYSLQLQ